MKGGHVSLTSGSLPPPVFDRLQQAGKAWNKANCNTLLYGARVL